MVNDMNKIRNAVIKNMNEVYKVRQFYDAYIQNLGGNVITDDPVINPNGDNGNENNDPGGTGLSDKEAKKLAAKQKHDLDIKLKNLETSHNDEVTKINQYQSENQESDVEYRHKLLMSESEYYGQKKALLEGFLEECFLPGIKG